MAKEPDRRPARAPSPNPVKDPDGWTTGDEPMTGAGELPHILATEAGESVKDDLSKAEGSWQIEELQGRTGRGKSAGG